jgi:hypothetical protein
VVREVGVASKVTIVLTPGQLDFAERIAAVEWPRRPDGNVYLGKAMRYLVLQGMEHLRQRWEDAQPNTMEDLYGCISEHEAAECGLSVVEDLSETRQGAGDIGPRGPF